MTMIRRVGDAATLFDVTTQTIRRWTDEFSDFLSTGANPEDGSNRAFTEDDMKVLAVVATVKHSGGTYEDAHARLRAGERGAVPEEPMSKEQQELAISQVIIQNRELRAQVNELQEAVDVYKQQLEDSKREVARLEGIIEEKERSSGDSGGEINEARKRIEDLLMKVAVLEYQLKDK